MILADERPDWRPCHFEEEILGCRVRFDFPICKLLDCVQRAEAAVRAAQPAAAVILANWLAQRTHGDMPERLRVKWDLTRRLYEAGFGRKDILELYRLLDWLLRLPEGMNQEFKQQVRTYEESKAMAYVTSIERMAKEEGRVEEAAELVVRQLRRRWSPLGPTVEKRVRALSVEQLENLAEALLDFASLAELESWLASH